MNIVKSRPFNNLLEMDLWFGEFQNRAIQICIGYGVPELWKNIRISRDEANYQFAIDSFGIYQPGSNFEKAIKEIAKTFEEF